MVPAAFENSEELKSELFEALPAPLNFDDLDKMEPESPHFFSVFKLKTNPKPPWPMVRLVGYPSIQMVIFLAITFGYACIVFFQVGFFLHVKYFSCV